MGLRISTNITSLNAQNTLARSTRNIEKSMAQLASGSRITKAADDAAGLSISENFKGQIRSLGQANRNANDGISLVQVAEGGLNEISNIVTRLRELSIQASSDTISDVERGFVNKEVQQLVNESQRIAKSTTFGKTQLLDGSAETFDFQVGANNDDFNDRISFDAAENVATTDELGIDSLDFSSKSGAQEALDVLDNAQTTVSSYRANLGALQNRLISTTENLGIQRENLSAANSRIRDADVAQATSEMTKNNILLQASTSTLAQANAIPQNALRLLG